MTNDRRRHWSKAKRKAYNKKKKTQRMRKVKRYARAFQMFEYYLGGYFNETLRLHEVVRVTDVEVRFKFQGTKSSPLNYPFITLLIDALNTVFHHRHVRIDCGWAIGNQLVCRARTVPPPPLAVASLAVLEILEKTKMQRF